MRGKSSWLVLMGLVLCASVLSLSPSARSQDGKAPPAAPEKKAVAMVAGQPIYEDELSQKLEGEMQKLRNQEYQLKSDTLEDMVNRKVLDSVAKKKGVSVEQLLAQEVDSKVPDPTDAQVQSFYNARRDQINRPLAEIKEQIRNAIKQGEVEQARLDYAHNLWHDAQVAILLSPPQIEIAYDPARVRGDPKAPVTIVEFSDFQCPYCQKAYPVVKDVLSKYAGSVKLAYMDFPLREIHPQAQMAAEAARCAAAQGKFWEYHDLLFSHPGQLEQEKLSADAQKLKLDEKLFESCMTDGKSKPAVESELQKGIKAGVAGTPAFFINGVPLSGALPLADFERAIDAQLAQLALQHAAH